MKQSLTHIRTSHVGRLPPPKGWEDMPARLANAELTDPASIAAEVTPAIAETVKKQVEAGIDCIGDGEFWTARSLAHYTAHFTGIEARPVAPGEPPTTRHSTRERDEFCDFYADCDRAGTLFLVPGEKPMPPVTMRVVARGPVKSKGPEAIDRQLDTFKAAIARSGAAVEEAFVPVLAPGWLDHFIFNEYYQTEDEFLFALADALREEYRAVVAAGFVLQIDDPGLPDWWDMLKPEPSVEAYRQFARRRIDAVNHALAGIPEERVRYHLCWGSWHGPHTHDLPLEHIIDLILEVKAQTYSFEAANVRHEHDGGCGRTQSCRHADAGCRQPRHQPRRAPAARRRPHPALRRNRRPREHHRRHRLRPRRPGPRRPRLGQIAHPRRRRAPRVAVPLALTLAAVTGIEDEERRVGRSPGSFPPWSGPFLHKPLKLSLPPHQASLVTSHLRHVKASSSSSAASRSPA